MRIWCTCTRSVASLVAVLMLALSPAVMADLSCGDNDAGDCFAANGTPYCDDEGCCKKVCAVDPFCCDTEWDQICADAATDLCGDVAKGACCFDNGCIMLSEKDCLNEGGRYKGDGTSCDDNPCDDGAECGDADTGDCFEANGTPYCDDEGCCKKVCAVDPFCCETEWDGLCADAATELCGDVVEGACCFDNGCIMLSEKDCLNEGGRYKGDGTSCNDDPCDDASDCGDPDTGDCFVANGTPYCDDEGCCEKVCAVDPFCCETEWDGLCADAAIDLCGDVAEGACCVQNGCFVLSEKDCINEGGDYLGDGTSCDNDPCDAGADCGDPDTGDCFVANGTPYCDDEGCCEKVCAVDPFCCDTEWDGLCADAAIDLCGNVAEGACCVQNACVVLSEKDCINEGGDYLGDGTSCDNDPCDDGADCGDADTGDCFVANGTPYCDDEGCCEKVCAVDPFCCDTEWDQLCADAAIDLCGNVAEGACCLCDGCVILSEKDCIAEGGEYQGDGTTCDSDPCNVPVDCPGDLDLDGDVDVNDLLDLLRDWGKCCGCKEDLDGDGDVDVNDLAILLGNYGDCDVDPGDCGAPDSGSCFEANGTPFCDDAECCAAVCAVDPFCCDTEWDGICADEAADLCGGVAEGACCFPNDCAVLTEKDCASEGGEYVGDGTSCDDCGDDEGCGSANAGDCFEANGTPYCNDAGCCKAVCAIDPFCCETEWDGICADAANDICLN